MSVQTQESAEKLASELVQIIRGLPSDTRPDDIFEVTKERFRDAGTHLYPSICGIVSSLHGLKSQPTRRSVGVQTGIAGSGIDEGKSDVIASEKTTEELNSLDELGLFDDGWNLRCEAEELEETDGSSSGDDLGSYAEVDLE